MRTKYHHGCSDERGTADRCTLIDYGWIRVEEQKAIAWWERVSRSMGTVQDELVRLCLAVEESQRHE